MQRLGKLIVVGRIVVGMELAAFIALAIWTCANLNAAPAAKGPWTITTISLFYAGLTPGVARGVRRIYESFTRRRLSGLHRRIGADSVVIRRQRAFEFLYGEYVTQIAIETSVLLGPALSLLLAFAMENHLSGLVAAIGLALCVFINFPTARQVRKWIKDMLHLFRSKQLFQVTDALSK